MDPLWTSVWTVGAGMGEPHLTPRVPALGAWSARAGGAANISEKRSACPTPTPPSFRAWLRARRPGAEHGLSVGRWEPVCPESSVPDLALRGCSSHAGRGAQSLGPALPPRLPPFGCQLSSHQLNFDRPSPPSPLPSGPGTSGSSRKKSLTPESRPLELLVPALPRGLGQGAEI